MNSISPFQHFNILPTKFNLALMASGEGTNVRAIIQAARRGELGQAEPMLVITNRMCGAVKVAQECDIPYRVVDRENFSSDAEWNAAILGFLQAFEIDAVALAGYMKLIDKQTLAAFEHKIINLHPSLLPAYPGAKAAQRIWADAHCKDSQLQTAARAAAGVSVHIANAELDQGQLLAQAPLNITLYSRESDYIEALHSLEHTLYPAVIAEFSRTLKPVQKTGTPYWLQRAQGNSTPAS